MLPEPFYRIFESIYDGIRKGKVNDHKNSAVCYFGIGLRSKAMTSSSLLKSAAEISRETVKKFIDARCCYHPQDWVMTTTLYDAFVAWCASRGIVWKGHKSSFCVHLRHLCGDKIVSCTGNVGGSFRCGYRGINLSTS